MSFWIALIVGNEHRRQRYDRRRAPLCYGAGTDASYMLLVLSNREHIIALEAMDKGLVGTLILFPYEVRSEQEHFDEIQDVKVTKDRPNIDAQFSRIDMNLRVSRAQSCARKSAKRLDI